MSYNKGVNEILNDDENSYTKQLLRALDKNIKSASTEITAICAVSGTVDVVELSRKFEYLAVNVLMASLAYIHELDRNKHRTIVELENAITDRGWEVGTYFSYFMEEYMDGRESGDLEDYPSEETISTAMSELLDFYADKVKI